MQVIPTALPEILIFEPKVFGDTRGFFLESFNEREFLRVAGLNHRFVQDNHSRSAKGVLRGLHYQIQQPQGKLVRVVREASSTWPWTCADTRPHLANGWESN